MPNARIPVHPDFAKLWEAGANDRELSRIVGVNEKTVRKWREEREMRPRYGKLPTPPVPRGFRVRLRQKWDCETLGEHFGVSPIIANRWKRAVEIEAEGVEIEHGTLLAYTEDRCRCDMCISVYRVDQGDQRSMRLLRTAANGGIAPIEVHNSQTASNWGCKCDTCLESKRAANALYKRRLRERKARAQADALAAL